ncbi:MAG: hypothetical protein IJX23_03315 [Clostridia bacterium]|nr:hypothetical protein [Clostridia bacterium]
MARTSINMIDLCNLAWDRKSKLAPSEYYTKTKNLLSHAYVECGRIIGREKVFVAFQRVLVFLMLCDDDFLQGEYDCYKTFCDYANYEALSVSDCRSLYNRLSVDDLTEEISTLVSLRDSIDPDNYEAMVQGFCYFCLSGDKAMDENEYYILRCFFQNCDYAPSSWDQFKREW